MADEGRSGHHLEAPLRVYLVLARGYSIPMTVVTAANPEGAMRALLKARTLHAAPRPAAAVAPGRSACLLAEIDAADILGASDGPGAWLAALARSEGVIVLFEEGAP